MQRRVCLHDRGSLLGGVVRGRDAEDVQRQPIVHGRYVRHHDRGLCVHAERQQHVQRRKCLHDRGSLLGGVVRGRDAETVQSNQCVQHSRVRHKFWPMRPNTDNVPAGERPVPRRSVRPDDRLLEPTAVERDNLHRRRLWGLMLRWRVLLRFLMATCT